MRTAIRPRTCCSDMPGVSTSNTDGPGHPVCHMCRGLQPAGGGRGPPPAANAADTRERIVRAAREVFSELSYDAATFQAIAIRADLTRPAINHYFSSKRVLYREVGAQTDALV